MRLKFSMERSYHSWSPEINMYRKQLINTGPLGSWSPYTVGGGWDSAWAGARGAWGRGVLHITKPLMNRLNKTESAIFPSASNNFTHNKQLLSAVWRL